MDGRGRALDNVFIERLWRSVKYENIYLQGYETAVELERGLASYFDFYCYERLHMALGYQTPWEVYSAGRAYAAGEMKTFRRKKFWPAARLSSHVNLNPIRASSSTAARGPVRGPAGRWPTPYTNPKNCPTIGVHLTETMDCGWLHKVLPINADDIRMNDGIPVDGVLGMSSSFRDLCYISISTMASCYCVIRARCLDLLATKYHSS